MGFKNYKADAAWSIIMKRLDGFKRGDDITLDWIQLTGGLQDGTLIEARLRTYWRNRGIVCVKNGAAYRLLTQAEQVEHARGRQKHVKREHARTLGAIGGLDRDEMSEQQRKQTDHLRIHVVAQLEEHKRFETTERAILGVPEPRPRLQAVAKK